MGKCNRDRFNSLIWKDWNGAPGRTRTCDPLLRRQMLYPLSYGRSPKLTAPTEIALLILNHFLIS